VTHARLDRLDGAALEQELSESKHVLEQLTGAPVRMLSLPFGACSAAVVAAARRIGYEQVFANVPVAGQNGSRGLEGRVNVTPRDWPVEFDLKIRGAYDWMALGVPAKRLVLQVIGKA
jgi:peptidoglycan/xylan/chitin deacetylase (PgdA/CDA1 family)